MTHSSPPSRESAGERTGHLVLVGMMGSGKSTVGQALAARLHRPFADSDALIEARTGQTVKQIFAERGEPAFRAEESAVLEEALASPSPAVIAAAGGAVLDAANRRLLRAAARSGLVVWLRAAPAVLAQRVVPSLASGGHRPLLEHDPAEALNRLDAIRRPLYEEVADIAIDVDDRSVDEIADIVLARMEERP
ncbi:MAG TPA: shikimate kinase [Acidimicrobiales bacterium]|nr:shikimate kinase [Acidimicrobiales bacterium]